jgi:rod shape-determining protein MreC
MEYSPPPLFKQGASARVKVVFFALISISLLFADSHLRSLSLIRQVINTAVYPVQMLALVPRDALLQISEYFDSLSALQSENRALRRVRTLEAQALQQSQHYAAENAQLRRLLETRERTPSPAIVGEILYDARDKFSRKIILDRGSQNRITLGLPVIDDTGVVGQVTRVFPYTSEVTLLTDKDQAIPVQVVRNGVRSIAYGGDNEHQDLLSLRFMAANADIKVGDILVTSGIDGVYPAGLAVARVLQVESNTAGAFANIICKPLAGIDRHRQMLILLAGNTQAARPPVQAPEEIKTSRKRAREMAKESTTVVPAAGVQPGAAARTGTATAAVAPGTTPAPAGPAPKNTTPAAKVPAPTAPVPKAPAPAVPVQKTPVAPATVPAAQLPPAATKPKPLTP